MDTSADSPAPVKIIVVVGTRPEAIKLVPVILALRASDRFEPVVISTGQHHDLVAGVLERAGIVPAVSLWAGSAPRSLNDLVATVMQRFGDFCVATYGDAIGHAPDTDAVLAGRVPAAVLVHGDTSSAFAAALAAFHARLPVVHVEAGLRAGTSNLSPFPEELNRRLISSIACFHLAPTIENAENLIRERIEHEQVFVTGNTGIDALRWAASIDTTWDDDEVRQLVESDSRIVVVTAHRRENWNAGLTGIAHGVSRLAADWPDVRFVVPLHPNPLVRDQLGRPLEDIPNVHLTGPLPYAQFAHLLDRAHLVITDSGGIQEEAPSLGTPVLVARETTERGEGVEAGTLALVGTDPELIRTTADRLLRDDEAHAAMAGAENPYGDGRASERIVGALQHLLDRTHLPPAPYGPGFTRAAILEAAGYERTFDGALFVQSLLDPSQVAEESV